MLADLKQLSLKELKDSLEELKKMQSKVLKQIEDSETQRKEEALLELEQRAVELGFSLTQLTKYNSEKQRLPAVQKYANPADPSETWSGRGRKPHWFTAEMAAGKSPEELLTNIFPVPVTFSPHINGILTPES